MRNFKLKIKYKTSLETSKLHVKLRIPQIRFTFRLRSIWITNMQKIQVKCEGITVYSMNEEIMTNLLYGQ